ncbi:hypothetical protein HW49_03985 [Porphyromonadaceae bacterium COT-184 OH4590]|nr:hypothetical protein HW49_03985 [Porphyromonadaceae bacterium COT-184 OH4590]
MRPKEINAIIKEQTEDFFKQEGFKYVQKSIGYIKNENKCRISYGFVHYEYHPEYEYEIVLFVQLTEIEEIYKKIRNGVTVGITYVFPLSYFLDKENYVNNNPEWNIEYKKDIPPFSKALTDTYTKYVKEFIPFITQPQNMLNFLLSEIATGKDYANDENVFARVLILMKLLNYPMEELQAKLAEFKSKLANYREDIKQTYYTQMDNIVSGNW